MYLSQICNLVAKDGWKSHFLWRGPKGGFEPLSCIWDHTIETPACRQGTFQSGYMAASSKDTHT